MSTAEFPGKVSVAAPAAGGTYAFPFDHAGQEELYVALEGADGTTTILQLNVDYTVSPTGYSAGGGTVTLLAEPAAGAVLVIDRSTREEQDATLRTAERPVERGLDKLTQIAQDLRRRLTFSVSRTATTLLLVPALGAALSFAQATQSLAGLMSAADKAKLDGLVNSTVQVDPGAFDSLAQVTATSIPVVVRSIRARGHTDPGDCPPMTLTREAAEPAGHAGWRRSVDGAYWVLTGDADVRMFGAKLDGLTDGSAALDAAITYSQTTGNPTVRVVGGGTLLLATPVRRDALTRDLVLQSDGVTLIRRADSVVVDSTGLMLRFRNDPSSTVTLRLDDLNVDGNARGNGIPMTVAALSAAPSIGATVSGDSSGATARIVKVSGAILYLTAYTNLDFTAGETLTIGGGITATAPADPPGRFVWEHTYALAAIPASARGMNLVVNGLKGFDPTADLLGLGSTANTFGHIRISGVVETGRERVRSGITITAGYDHAIIDNVDVDRLEIETNTYQANHQYDTLINNVTTRQSLDLASGAVTSSSDGRPPLLLSNVVAREHVYLAGFNAKIIGLQARVSDHVRLVGGRWHFVGGSFNFDDGAAGSYASGYGLYHLGGGTAPEQVILDGVEFNADATAALTYFVGFPTDTGPAGGVHKVLNCKFRSSKQAIYCRFASLRAEGNEFGHVGTSIVVDIETVGTSQKLWLKRNTLLSATGYLVRLPATGNAIEIRMGGNDPRTIGQVLDIPDFTKIAAPRGAGTVLDFRTLDEAEASAAPTSGNWVRGARVWNRAPATGQPMGWICTTSGTAGAGAAFTPMPNL